MPSYLPTVVRDLSGPDDIPRISAFINALYIAGWTVGGFTWGYISDKIGRAKALALSVGSFGVLTILISSAPSWEWVVAVRLLSGFAVGGILVISPTLLSEIWPQRTRSIMIGIDSIGFPVGIFSTGLVTVLVDSWRSAFFVGAVPIALGVLSIWALTESDNWKNARTAQKVNPTFDPDATPNLIKGSIIFGSMLIGLWGMFSWISSWVQSLPNDTEMIGLKLGGIAMMLLGAGGLTGGFISGWVSNALGVRRALLLCFCGCFLMSFLLFAMNKSFSPIIYPELALLSLFFGISQGLLSIYIPQLFPYHIRGTYTGICFNIGRIPTAFAVLFVGLLVKAVGGYSNALLLFAGIFIIGFISIYLTKDEVKKNI
jgi:MFS family permease